MPVEPDIRRALDHVGELLLGTFGMRVGGAAAGQKAIPEMQDLTPAEIRTRLVEFKADQRPGTIMPKISKGYSDEAIEALAVHFGKKS